MDNRVIKVTNENGVEFSVEVLDIFNVKGYDKDYILYTFGEEIDEENEKVYISILKEVDNNFELISITDPEEFFKVKEAINESINIEEGDING